MTGLPRADRILILKLIPIGFLGNFTLILLQATQCTIFILHLLFIMRTLFPLKTVMVLSDMSFGRFPQFGAAADSGTLL